MRRHVPPLLWDLAARSSQAVGDAATRLVAGVVSVVLRILPDGVRLGLREGLDLKRPMDYEKAKIWLRITSPMERRIRLRSCQKEPETVAWIERSIRPGDVLYDIGANVGAYSLVAAKATQGRAMVYAFEPSYRTFASLMDNIGLNDVGDVVVPFQVALSNRTGLSDFRYWSVEAGAARHPGVGDAVPTDGGAPAHKVLVYRLDDFVQQFGIRSPTHLKLDVDGGELEILAGAPDVLRSAGLRSVLVELVPQASEAGAARELLRTYGFALESERSHGGEVANYIFVR